MIRTLGEMLETLRRAEARRLYEVDIKHARTIGSLSISCRCIASPGSKRAWRTLEGPTCEAP